MIRTGNLLRAIPAPGASELFEELLAGEGFRLERIVSQGHRSEEGFWYDQEADEWVVLVSGRATLELECPPFTLELGPGDYVFLPARSRHRVAATSADPPAVWLALHAEPG